MDENSVGFMYLKNTFPRIRDAKLREGIFVGLKIGELIQDVNFEDQLSEVEKSAWKSFIFLVNHKTEYYRDMVADLVQPYKAMWCHMSLKVHFVDSHLRLLPRKSTGSEL